MMIFRVFAARLRALFAKRRREAQLNDEIQAHLDLLIDEQVRRGLSADEARAAARREFGGIEQVKEVYRDQRGLPMVEATMQDLRYALRTFRATRRPRRRTPGFSGGTGNCRSISAFTTVKMALSGALKRMVLNDALRMVALGLAFGVPLAIAIALSIRTLLFGVEPQDLANLMGACLVLTAAGMLAAYVPARRAANVDPMVALRQE